MSSTREQELDAALRVLVTRSPSRWRDLGFGMFACSSCGAARTIDYGDHDQPPTEQREPCAPTCPWGVAERLLIS